MKLSRPPLAYPLIALLFCGGLVLTSCYNRETEITTGRVLDCTELPDWKGDVAYAELKYSALAELYSSYRGTLSNLGIVNWDERFDCNRFASLYIAVAHTKYAVAAFQSSSKAQALALAEVWYRGPDGRGHAVVEARTDSGVVFIDPQTGIPIAPPPANAIYFRKW